MAAFGEIIFWVALFLLLCLILPMGVLRQGFFLKNPLWLGMLGQLLFLLLLSLSYSLPAMRYWSIHYQQLPSMLLAVLIFSLLNHWLEPMLRDERSNLIRTELLRRPWQHFILAVLLAPLVEELIFRWYLLEALLHYLLPFWAILLSALVFALLHGQKEQVVGAMIGGLLLGYLWNETHSLGLCILCHSLCNGIAWWRLVRERNKP